MAFTRALHIIGIDFGVHNTRIAVTHHTTRKLEMIPNDEVDLATPTYVTWDGLTGEAIVGKDAKQQAIRNPQNTVFDCKRLLGHSFHSERVQVAIPQLPYKIVEKDNKPFIQVEIQGQVRELSPEQVEALVLVKMKQNAEKYLGYEVLDTVVTVPQYVGDSQRLALQNAGTIAGFMVQRIVNEATAAASTYSVEKNVQHEQTVLVVDFGGATFDATLLLVEDGVYETLATSRHDGRRIGGDDFVQWVMDACVSQWQHDQQTDISTDVRMLQRLRLEAERVQRALSSG